MVQIEVTLFQPETTFIKMSKIQITQVHSRNQIAESLVTIQRTGKTRPYLFKIGARVARGHKALAQLVKKSLQYIEQHSSEIAKTTLKVLTNVNLEILPIYSKTIPRTYYRELRTYLRYSHNIHLSKDPILRELKRVEDLFFAFAFKDGILLRRARCSVSEMASTLVHEVNHIYHNAVNPRSSLMTILENEISAFLAEDSFQGKLNLGEVQKRIKEHKSYILQEYWNHPITRSVKAAKFDFRLENGEPIVRAKAQTTTPLHQ